LDLFSSFFLGVWTSPRPPLFWPSPTSNPICASPRLLFKSAFLLMNHLPFRLDFPPPLCPRTDFNSPPVFFSGPTKKTWRPLSSLIESQPGYPRFPFLMMVIVIWSLLFVVLVSLSRLPFPPLRKSVFVQTTFFPPRSLELLIHLSFGRTSVPPFPFGFFWFLLGFLSFALPICYLVAETSLYPFFSRS